MSTPYLKWREKNVSLYEMVYDASGMSRMQTFFPSVRKTLSRMMGLQSKQVKMRRVGVVVSIYVSMKDWDRRRTDDISLNTKRDYSNYLLGILHYSHDRGMAPLGWK